MAHFSLVSQVVYENRVDLLISSTRRVSLCLPSTNRRKTCFTYCPLRYLYRSLIINLYRIERKHLKDAWTGNVSVWRQIPTTCLR